jgi:enoyl-CoA hydratase/3-hydroxyacyl-CoA dehydrogenase
MSKNDHILIRESFPLKKDRKGGAANLVLTALVIEAGRMLDEGFERESVEAAAVKAFGMSTGFLAVMESAGREKALALMADLSDDSDPEDPFIKKFDNFFSPPASFVKGETQGTGAGQGISPASPAAKAGEDFMLLDLLGRRFKGVLFMIAVDLVESGVSGIADVDGFCKADFGWAEGPFGMMNRIGPEESLRIVTEKMELSHRREINFPIPRLLIDHAGLKQPWMIPS